MKFGIAIPRMILDAIPRSRKEDSGIENRLTLSFSRKRMSLDERFATFVEATKGANFLHYDGEETHLLKCIRTLVYLATHPPAFGDYLRRSPSWMPNEFSCTAFGSRADASSVMASRRQQHTGRKKTFSLSILYRHDRAMLPSNAALCASFKVVKAI